MKLAANKSISNNFRMRNGAEIGNWIDLAANSSFSFLSFGLSFRMSWFHSLNLIAELNFIHSTAIKVEI